MSATDARTLIGNLIAGSGWDESSGLGQAAGRVADQILAIHAHELAEKIRLHKDEARGAVQATKVVDFCADLIDPEIE